RTAGLGPQPPPRTALPLAVFDQIVLFHALVVHVEMAAIGLSDSGVFGADGAAKILAERPGRVLDFGDAGQEDPVLGVRAALAVVGAAGRPDDFLLGGVERGVIK